MSDWPAASAAAGAEMLLIATTPLAAPAASMTFSGIDTSYRFFQVLASVLKSTSNAILRLTLNNDSGSNYGYQQAGASGASGLYGRGNNSTQPGIELNDSVWDASTMGFSQIEIQKPAAGLPAQALTLTSLLNTAAIHMHMIGSNWANVADLISRIDITSGVGNMDTGTRVSVGGAKTA